MLTTLIDPLTRSAHIKASQLGCRPVCLRTHPPRVTRVWDFTADNYQVFKAQANVVSGPIAGGEYYLNCSLTAQVLSIDYPDDLGDCRG